MQVLLASRLRVQRYGGYRHHARKCTKKAHFFVKSGHVFAFRLCKPCQTRRFQGHFGAFRRAFGRKVGETRSQGLDEGRKMKGKGGAPIYNNRKRGRERRKGHGRGQQKSQTGALNRRLRERRQWEGRLRMTILRGQSEYFEGALWPHLGEKMATTRGGSGHAGG